MQPSAEPDQLLAPIYTVIQRNDKSTFTIKPSEFYGVNFNDLTKVQDTENQSKQGENMLSYVTLKERLQGEIPITSDMQMTPP